MLKIKQKEFSSILLGLKIVEGIVISKRSEAEVCRINPHKHFSLFSQLFFLTSGY